MESFATFIRNIADAELPSDRRPIKVAVIDDGIDAVYNEEQFSATLKGGESFCTGRKRPPYFFSSTGHGTLMADLVQRVCPKVHLYVARLDELQGELEGRVHPTAESAAKVRHPFRSLQVTVENIDKATNTFVIRPSGGLSSKTSTSFP